MLEKNNNKIQIDKHRRDYRIEVVDNEFVLNRWDEIESILYRVFGDSKFNDKFLRTRPAEHTLKILGNLIKKV